MAKHSERGMALLIEMLIVFSLMLVALAIAGPAYVKVQATVNEKDAAIVLWRIDRAELASSQTFSGYMSPQNLAQNAIGEPATGTACAPNFISGGDAIPAASKGYAFVFIPGTAISPGITSSTNCLIPPTIYQTYAITADPQTAYGRHFFTDQSGVVRFADGNSQASASSSPYTVSGSTGIGAGSSDSANAAGSSIPPLSAWTQGVSVVRGQQFTYSNPGGTGEPALYENATGQASGQPPPFDLEDYFEISTTLNTVGTLYPVGQEPLEPQLVGACANCNLPGNGSYNGNTGTFTGQTIEYCPLAGTACTTSSSNQFTVTQVLYQPATFTVNVQPPLGAGTNGQILIVSLIDSSGLVYASCTFQANGGGTAWIQGNSCSRTLGGLIQIGTSLEVQFNLNTTPAYLQAITWAAQ